jgi:predicted metalloprotease with PDZ domain
MTHYRLAFADPAGHLLDVSMTIAKPVALQTVSMPAWIPGSYLIREFAKNITTLFASQHGKPVTIKKTDKATWQFDCSTDAPLVIGYRVYAWDRSVRTNYFDTSRGFVNPAASMLCNDAAPDALCTLEIVTPSFTGGESWKVATSMTAKSLITMNEYDSHTRGFGVYEAASYDELIDHPIECAAFDEFRFDAGGVSHRFVISGKHRGDLDRLKRDAQKICQGHVDLFGDAKPPFSEYVFQLHVLDDGYGGLEHRASTALICPRNDLPVKGVSALSDGYLSLLGLISHEYFHAWNVKRIKPVAFMTKGGAYDTANENYTSLLWLFEGFTSYYDELMLLRVGLITEADFLKLIARHLTQLLRTPARRSQSLAESSFDAWTKYYRQDENAPNAVVSYYLKGGLIALLLDLQLRTSTAKSLDDVMRYLWTQFGKQGIGVPEDVFAVFQAATGVSMEALREFETKFVSGVVEPAWFDAFAAIGVSYTERAALSAADRGGVANAQEETNVRHWGAVLNESGIPTLRFVLNGSAAHQAGLCAGDTLVAIDGLRAALGSVGKHIARYAPGDAVTISYFRHDVLHSTQLVAPKPVFDTAALKIDSSASDAIKTLRDRWLVGAMK